jgi:glycosidase
MKKLSTLLLLVTFSILVQGQAVIDRIEPPFWWAGMADTTLQLMIHGEQIADLNVLADDRQVRVAGIRRVENPNYLFVDLVVPRHKKPGTVKLVFEYQREIVRKVDYELWERKEGSAAREGFGKSDVIYLLMPDRFSNGDPANDSVPEMYEKADRSNPDGRHGGDIQGILDRAEYLETLGVTALWINPLLENNHEKYSYHGYAITNFYRVDPRFGTNEDYREMVEEFHDRGIKVIMDMVFNHCGTNHWWFRDMPMGSWVHQFDEYTRSNFRGETMMDPYASDFDRTRMQTGWFDRHMADLNQHNPALAAYLIQNSIWWIEFAGLDGIRMDTYPYSYKDFMARWMDRIRLEYPNFSVLGETWLQKEAHTAYWQDGSPVGGNYRSNLSFVTDFPLNYAVKDAFNEQEGWTNGLARIYYVLSQDFVYADPFRNVIFGDNHDLTRLYTSLGENYASYKMAMAVLLTTRGIPSIYYGTEYLMTGEESKGHGFIRQDFPGGEWQSAVGSRQLAVGSQEQEAHDYLSRLLNWRKGASVIHSGKLMQFVPQDGIYVYFRYSDAETVMVVVNKNPESRDLSLDRFRERLEGFSTGKDVATEGVYELKTSLRVPAGTALILELN